MRNIYFNLLSFLLLNFTFFSSNLFAQKISKNVFSEVRNLSKKIVTICPPQDCVVIGIGRSPTPFITFLKMEQESYARNLPLSGFRYGVGYHRHLSGQMREKLYKHFDIFLPSLKELAGKSVLLIDFSQTGDSLVAARTYMEAYYQKQMDDSSNDPTISKMPEVSAAALTGKYRWIDSRNRGDKKIKYQFVIDDFELSLITGRQGFDDYSQYKGFKILEDACPINAENLHNEKYLGLLAIMEEMNKGKRSIVKKKNENSKCHIL